MNDVELAFAEAHKGKSKEELSRVLDEEVERFSKYMSTLGDSRAVGPLNNPEKMLIKTFLVFKVKEVSL